MRYLKLKDTVNFLRSFDVFLREHNILECHIGLIGGTALELFNLRESTKDIDIMFFSKPPQEVTYFIENYRKEKNTEIDVGVCGGFTSMLLDGEMFSQFSFILPSVKRNRFMKFKFKNLKIHILIPECFMLVKLEAASKRGERDYADAVAIKNHFQVSKKEFQKICQEYDVEIEMVPRLPQEIEIFLNDEFK